MPDQSQRRQASASCAIDTSRMKQLQKTVARAKTRKRCNIESVLCGVVPIICNTPQQATLIRTCHRRLREKKSHNRFPPDPCHHKKLLIPSATRQNNPHIPPAEMEYGTAFSILFFFFFEGGVHPSKSGGRISRCVCRVPWQGKRTLAVEARLVVVLWGKAGQSWS